MSNSIKKNAECGNYCLPGVPEEGCRIHDPEKPFGFDTRHCWAVQGTDADGKYTMRRYVPGSAGVFTLSDAQDLAETRERMINNAGGKVVSVKQHLDVNDLWQDS